MADNKYFWVVYVLGDVERLDWYEVHPTRKSAMEAARGHAENEEERYPNGVRRNDEAYAGMECQGYVEVARCGFLYYGA